MLTLLLAIFVLALPAELAAPTSAKGRLERYTSCYATEMQLLPTWAISVDFHAIEIDGRVFSGGTVVQPNYYQARISFDTTQIDFGNDAGLRTLVVHELMHVWLWELTELATSTHQPLAQRWNEQATTLISRWPVWQELCK